MRGWSLVVVHVILSVSCIFTPACSQFLKKKRQSEAFQYRRLLSPHLPVQRGTRSRQTVRSGWKIQTYEIQSLSTSVPFAVHLCAPYRLTWQSWLSIGPCTIDL